MCSEMCASKSVSVSRAQHDTQIYTNNGSKLSNSLSRESSQRTAAQVEQQPAAQRRRFWNRRPAPSAAELPAKAIVHPFSVQAANQTPTMHKLEVRIGILVPELQNWFAFQIEPKKERSCDRQRSFHACSA
jgi:hypothetical protein